jgi:hypothetical protein
MSGTDSLSGAQLVDDAHQALRQAHRRLLDPTPQGIDCSRAAFATAVNRLSELRRLLQESPNAGCGLLPAMKDLHGELETVTLLLQSAAEHQSNLLQRMLRAATLESGDFAAPADTSSRSDDTGSRLDDTYSSFHGTGSRLHLNA